LRTVLVAVIAVECLLLTGGASAYLVGGLDGLAVRPPPVPVFRPPLYEARIGDLVRYERQDLATGRVLGYVDYEVKLVVVIEGSTTGPEVVLNLRETEQAPGEAAPRLRERLMRIQPRALTHGFLPPRFEEDDDYPTGARPVVKRIEARTFDVRRRPTRGFQIDAVIPRRSLTETAERFWVTDKVPVFGVARWERGNEVLVLHRMDWGRDR
jgi:hypothetical protein